MRTVNAKKVFMACRPRWKATAQKHYLLNKFL
jgi:hypothetical protein